MTLIFGFKIKPNIPRQTGTLENTCISDAKCSDKSQCWELPNIVQTLHELSGNENNEHLNNDEDKNNNKKKITQLNLEIQ